MRPLIRTPEERDLIARDLGYESAEALRLECEAILADRRDFADDYARDADREYGEAE